MFSIEDQYSACSVCVQFTSACSVLRISILHVQCGFSSFPHVQFALTKQIDSYSVSANWPIVTTSSVSLDTGKCDAVGVDTKQGEFTPRLKKSILLCFD